jgi:hypothetical protein
MKFPLPPVDDLRLARNDIATLRTGLPGKSIEAAMTSSRTKKPIFGPDVSDILTAPAQQRLIRGPPQDGHPPTGLNATRRTDRLESVWPAVSDPL